MKVEEFIHVLVAHEVVMVVVMVAETVQVEVEVFQVSLLHQLKLHQICQQHLKHISLQVQVEVQVIYLNQVDFIKVVILLVVVILVD